MAIAEAIFMEGTVVKANEARVDRTGACSGFPHREDLSTLASP